MNDLDRALTGFVALWSRLADVNGAPQGSGRPSPKSRPPTTLAAVALVIEVTNASRESVLELCVRTYPSVPDNLAHIVTALDTYDPHDLREWWTTALLDWTHRARVMLGDDPQLVRDIYGAKCPACHAHTVMLKVDNELRLLPALGLVWREEAPGKWSIWTVYCRRCAASWHAGTLVQETFAPSAGN